MGLYHLRLGRGRQSVIIPTLLQIEPADAPVLSERDVLEEVATLVRENAAAILPAGYEGRKADVAGSGSAVTFCGELTNCRFTTRASTVTYTVLLPGEPAASGSSAAPADVDRYESGFTASFTLVVEVSHRGRAAERTHAALAAEPGKLHRYLAPAAAGAAAAGPA